MYYVRTSTYNFTKKEIFIPIFIFTRMKYLHLRICGFGDFKINYVGFLIQLMYIQVRAEAERAFLQHSMITAYGYLDNLL